jgi:hypothetical protein
VRANVARRRRRGDRVAPVAAPREDLLSARHQC